MAIQYKKTIIDIMMMQHSFPTISMISKMVAEDWMMGKMKSPLLHKIIKMLF